MSRRWTWHGGGLRAAQAHFGARGHASQGLPWIDLSTGINPHAWPVPPRQFDWQRLPDEQDLLTLEACAAAHFGIEPSFVCAVPGTEIGLRLIGSILPARACHFVPTYRTHGEMFEGSEPITPEEHGHASGRTLILASPNNPDGRRLDKNTLPALVEDRGPEGWLLVDEAFADTDAAISIADQIGDQRRLVVFRSFGKFFGLAGVRLGFVLGPTSLLARIRHKLGAWPLSAPAIAIGKEAYDDRAWIEATRTRLVDDATALDVVLRGAGLEPTGDCPLFRLVETPDPHGLFERLAGKAILTRPFADNPQWLRVGLPGNAAALTRLAQALADG